MGLFGKKDAPAVDKIIAPEIQVMMLGARRVGKTSMLASMYNSFSNVAAGTNLAMYNLCKIERQNHTFFQNKKRTV